MRRKGIPATLDRRVRGAARNRCGYCLTPQDLLSVPLEIDHLTPVVRGGSDNEENLWLACPVCNGHKSDKIEAIDPDTGKSSLLFNPRFQSWTDHFRWSADGLLIVGVTPIGRATVVALHLNTDLRAFIVRTKWVNIGWFPPKD